MVSTLNNQEKKGDKDNFVFLISSDFHHKSSDSKIIRKKTIILANDRILQYKVYNIEVIL